MSIGELTDRGAVLSAIEECDAIGRDAFLAKYGFGRSRSYWLVHEGKRYDSKAIAGAAFGYQFPDRGPLSPKDFSGGEDRLQPVMEKLGFGLDVDLEVTLDDVSGWLGALSTATLAGGQMAPHKPLLALLVLRRVTQGKGRLAPVDEIATELRGILDIALPETESPSPWEPIWRLEPQVWELVDAEGVPFDRVGGGVPPVARMRQRGVTCGLTQRVYEVLEGSPESVERIQNEIIGQYLAKTPEAAIAKALGQVPGEPRVWWVNQGRTYQQERDGGYVWAPALTKAGRPAAHHTAVGNLHPGDVVLHYSGGRVRALGCVEAAPQLSGRPNDLPDGLWGEHGHRAEVRYFDLEEPISLEELEDRPRSLGPFSRTGAVKQGYLYQLPPDWAAQLQDRFANRWPVGSPWAPKRHWLFQANPQKWDLAKRLETWEPGELEPWTLMQRGREVRDGDDVLLFSSGSDGGILAIGTVVGEPSLRPRPDWRQDGPDPQVSIDVSLVATCVPPIGRTRLKDHPILSGLAVFKFAQATNFKVTDEEWNAVLKLLADQSASTSQAVVVYVGKSSETNFSHSFRAGRWGWRKSQSDYSLIRPGDLILFALGYTGGNVRVQPEKFVGYRFRRLIVGKVVAPVAQESEPYWPDETSEVTYPFRLSYELLDEDQLVEIAELDERFGGPVADAFRRSALGGGKGVLVETTEQRPDPAPTMREVVGQFETDLRAAGVNYGVSQHKQLVLSFLTSLATKRFVILTGLSGSGKTKLAQSFGEWLGESEFKIIAVRPDWTSPDALLGYENGLSELQTNGYAWHVPEPLEFILRAHSHPSAPHLLLLDEMNLAHVERYFADVLSGMESSHSVIPNLVLSAGEWRLADRVRRRLPVPSNLFIVGTVNVDETTYMFSPKVLDRANTLEFRVSTEDLQFPPNELNRIRRAPRSLGTAFLSVATSPAAQTTAGLDVAKWMKELHERLSRHGREFGHRTYLEAIRFANLLSLAGDAESLHALDLQVLQKVLPKYHGSVRELSEPLNDLAAWCFVGPGQLVPEPFDAAAPTEGAPALPQSFDKAHRMARRLRANHFVSFAE